MLSFRPSRLGALLAASGVLVVAAPAVALEGEGPNPIPTVEPCAAIIGPDRLDNETPRSEVEFRFEVRNCSRFANRFKVTLRGVLEVGTVPTPCATAATTVGARVPAASGTEVRMAPPGPVSGGCALSAGEYFYTVIVRDAVTRKKLSSISFRTVHDSL